MRSPASERISEFDIKPEICLLPDVHVPIAKWIATPVAILFFGPVLRGTDGPFCEPDLNGAVFAPFFVNFAQSRNISKPEAFLAFSGRFA